MDQQEKPLGVEFIGNLNNQNKSEEIKAKHLEVDSKKRKKCVVQRCKCSECSISFSNKFNLERHIRKKHPNKLMDFLSQKQTSKMKSEKRVGKTYYECSECPRCFDRKDNLLRHVRKKHPNKLMDFITPKEFKFPCSKCNRKFNHKNKLKIHMKEQHTISTTRKPHICAICRSEFDRKSIIVHLESCHEISLKPECLEFNTYEKFCSWKALIQSESKYSFIKEGSTGNRHHYFICSRSGHKSESSERIDAFCPASIKVHVREDQGCLVEYQKQHVGHTNEIFPPSGKKSRIRKPHVCAICRGEFDRRSIIVHLESCHEISLKPEFLEFNTYEEFCSWRALMQNESKSSFIKEGGKNSSTGNRHHYFICGRSGHKSESKGERLKRSERIDAFCPASIKVHVREDQGCLVEYQKQHVGHTNEIFSPSKKKRKSLATKGASKLPLDVIIDDVQDNVYINEFQRNNLLTNQDLCNIESTFSIGSETMKHQNDATSVEMWVEEMDELERNSCILLYKPQGFMLESYPQVSSDDFILIIMNEAQKEILKKFGKGCICIDSTRGLNSYNFEMTTLVIQDNLGQGFPCAFLISNRVDECMLQIFYSEIKNVTGNIKCSIFMSDMPEFVYSAWCHEMGHTGKRLYCSWHVDRAWQKNLSKINGKEKQEDTYKLLKSLMEERDEHTFNILFQQAIKKLQDDEDTQEFAEYFVKYYSENVTSWAYCYRLHSELNMNMHIERIHKTIKYIYLKGKTFKRLDKAICIIMKFVRDKLYGRLIVLPKGMVSKKQKLANLRNRHQISRNLNLSVTKNDKSWLIPSTNSNKMYVVEQNKMNCTCQLLCTYCKACIHAFTCSCTDSAIQWNMCKHIHYICSQEKISENSQVDEDDGLRIIDYAELEVLVNQVQKEVSGQSLLERRNRLIDNYTHFVFSATSEQLCLLEAEMESLGPKLEAAEECSRSRFFQI